MDVFELDQHLAGDCVVVGDFPLSRVLLVNDSRYPWVILVPRVAGTEEIYQLNEADQGQLVKELAFVANSLTELFSADKMNVAALGNIVRQLHVHVVVRHRGDAAWPGPVWGQGVCEPYAGDSLQAVRERLVGAFADWLEM